MLDLLSNHNPALVSQPNILEARFLKLLSAWSFSSLQYVQNAVKNVEAHLVNSGESLPKKTTSPWTCDYRPKTDVTHELPLKQAAYFQSLIGVL